MMISTIKLQDLFGKPTGSILLQDIDRESLATMKVETMRRESFSLIVSPAVFG